MRTTDVRYGSATGQTTQDDGRVRSGAGSAAGLVRRARRAADLSQRDLAARLGVSQSRVARWETGRSSPSLADLEQVMSLAAMRLALLDAAGARVEPMREDAARDRAGRRFPAHVDPAARGWWLPPGAHLAPDGSQWLQRSAAVGDVRIGYDRGMWRTVLRGLFGTPPDHPAHDELVAAARAETTPPAGDADG